MRIRTGDLVLCQVFTDGWPAALIHWITDQSVREIKSAGCFSPAIFRRVIVHHFNHPDWISCVIREPPPPPTPHRQQESVTERRWSVGSPCSAHSAAEESMSQTAAWTGINANSGGSFSLQSFCRVSFLQHCAITLERCRGWDGLLTGVNLHTAEVFYFQ